MAKEGNYYFPLYYKRLLSSTVGWSNSEFGAYIRLLIHQFDNNDRIPDDLDELSRIAPGIKKQWPLLMKKFKKDDRGLFNEVMSEIFNEIQHKRLTNKRNGETGGRPKKTERLTETKPNGSEIKTETKPILITNKQNISTDVDIRNNGSASDLTSKQIQEVFTKAFGDQIWTEVTGMGHSLLRDELRLWMLQFNSSLVGDNIAGFNERVYKKMFGGWLNKQKSKGYDLKKPPVQSANSNASDYHKAIEKHGKD